MAEIRAMSEIRTFTVIQRLIIFLSVIQRLINFLSAIQRLIIF